MEIRTFLAFELPGEIRNLVEEVSIEMKKSPMSIKWVKTSNIHLTIIFMGNVEEKKLDAMEEAIDKICQQSGPFSISVKGAGVFPNKRKPNVLWLGLTGNIDKMSSFRDSLQKQLKPFGIKQEKRRFNPHLTLGRFRKKNRPNKHLHELLERYRDLTSNVCSLNELVLYKSELNPNGAVYTKLNTWQLIETPI